MKAVSEVRPSPIAGKWYPSNPQLLASEVDRYIQKAQFPPLSGKIMAVMTPHAGYLYSGPVAGYAFAALRGMTPDLVAIISPMHHLSFEPLLTTAHAAYATPLGNIPVDLEALNLLDGHLQEELGIKLSRIANDPEHSLEIELPFLQRALASPFRLLPIMVFEQSISIARGLGQALARLFKENLADQSILLVASTDLSHFYPQKIADILDKEFLRQVEAFDPEGVINIEKEGKGFACGRGALAAVLWAAREMGADHAQVLHHATSGDVTGDYSQVVGYAAAVITRRSG